MDKSTNQHSKPRVPLSGTLSEFRDALNDEIKHIESSGQSSTTLYAGRQIKGHDLEYWYHFNVDYAPALPADTPCKLVVGNEQFDVTVISFEENAIVVASKKPLPESIGTARLENGATVLMERLIRCIEDNAETRNSAGEKMFCTVGGDVHKATKLFSYNDIVPSPSLTENQNRAVLTALTNDISYIWGPPGTGKTTVIGQIIDELYKHNRSVLLVSHTNTAVDGAIESAVKKCAVSDHDNSTYPILRLGIPSKKPSNDKVLLNSHVEALGKDLYEKKRALEKRRAEAQRRQNEIQTIFQKAGWLESSHLHEIRDQRTNLVALGEQRNTNDAQIRDLIATIESVKKQHPEYQDYSHLVEDCNSKSEEYAQLSEQIASLRQLLQDAPRRLQTAYDEIKKHTRFASLKKSESEMMSEHFLRTEIQKAQNAASSIREEIDRLTEEQYAAQQIIANYEKKSGIGRFFSGTAALLSAQEKLKAATDRIPELESELRHQAQLEHEYIQQLDTLFVIREQMKAVLPSYDKAYWESAAHEIKTKQLQAQEAVPALEAELVELRDAIARLEERRENAKAAYAPIRKAEEQLQQLKALAETLNSQISTLQRLISEGLENERSLYETFYTTVGSSDSEIIDELLRLFERIKEELNAVELPKLKTEEAECQEAILKIFDDLKELEQQIQELEKQAILSARIVGTTLTKSYLSENLREREFDTVILDEASMASIPALWCAAYLAKNSIVIVGDFLQLPPIVMADTPMAKKWLGTDVFTISGMKEIAASTSRPENFVMLQDQFRMESDIAEIANIYYGKYTKLRSNDSNSKRNEARERFYEWYGRKKSQKNNSNITLIDTESLHAWVTGVPRGKNSHSRLNCFSAAVDVDLAFKFIEEKLIDLDPETAEPVENALVLIIAPYKPHVSRIEKLIDLEYKNRGFKDNLNFIRAGTIHSFQGSEADIVIFDLVIDEPHFRANLFMTDPETNEGIEKMFNVAITRARFKLFVVGNFAYCQRRAKNNALSRLLDELLNKRGLVKYDAKRYLPRTKFDRQPTVATTNAAGAKHIICLENSFYDYFMNDIRNFKHRLIIYSPFMTENRLAGLLPAFSDAISEGKQIIVVTKALSERGKREYAQYQKCERELIDIGVSLVHKKGMHEKLIFVDSSAVWSGSLNALSFTGLTGEIMERHEGTELVAEFEKLCDIERICTAVGNQYELKCPICGGEMFVRESDKGGIYWECENGDYSRNGAQQFPIDGVLRCECGAPYTFSMKNEPRWVCTANSRHYQKMRKSDLSLEKMAAIIPKSARKDVDRYFVQMQAKRESAKSKEKKPSSGKKTTTEKRGKENNSGQGKPILQLADNGTIIQEFGSVKAASRAVGVSAKSIRDAAKGIQKHAGGFCWKYKGDSAAESEFHQFGLFDADTK